MTFEHSPDAVEKEMESHPLALVTWVVIGTVALVVGIILMAKFAMFPSYFQVIVYFSVENDSKIVKLHRLLARSNI